MPRTAGCDACASEFCAPRECGLAAADEASPPMLSHFAPWWWGDTPETPSGGAAWKLHTDHIKAWGVMADWPVVERLGCAVTMEPGDALFAREDVWHRTQDLALDRVQLKLEVLRFGEASDYRAADTGRFDFEVGHADDAPDAKSF